MTSEDFEFYARVKCEEGFTGNALSWVNQKLSNIEELSLEDADMCLGIKQLLEK